MVQKDSLLILGYGGYGRMVAEAALASGAFHAVQFLDDTQTENVLGKCEMYLQFHAQYKYMYPAFGNNALRSKWLQTLCNANICVPTIMHPRAYISSSAVLGKGVVVLPNATIQGNTVIHDGCIINVNAVVDHDCILHECTHVAPGGIVKAGVSVPAQTKIESGTVLHREE